MCKERVPPIRPYHKFDSLGISTRVDVPIVSTVCLGRENGLHPVDCWVKRAVLEPKSCECVGDDLCDRRLRYLLESDLCGHAVDEHQAAQIDEARAVIFNIYLRLVCDVL